MLITFGSNEQFSINELQEVPDIFTFNLHGLLAITK